MSVSAPAAPAAPPSAPRVTAFMAPDSLTSFTAVATATGVTWKVLGQVVPGLDGQPGAVLCSVVVGALLCVYGAVRAEEPVSPRTIFCEAVIAFFNTMLIAASVLGIATVSA
jgi:hypothetical protein